MSFPGGSGATEPRARDCVGSAEEPGRCEHRPRSTWRSHLRRLDAIIVNDSFSCSSGRCFLITACVTRCYLLSDWLSMRRLVLFFILLCILVWYSMRETTDWGKKKLLLRWKEHKKETAIRQLKRKTAFRMTRIQRNHGENLWFLAPGFLYYDALWCCSDTIWVCGHVIPYTGFRGEIVLRASCLRVRRWGSTTCDWQTDRPIFPPKSECDYTTVVCHLLLRFL